MEDSHTGNSSQNAYWLNENGGQEDHGHAYSSVQNADELALYQTLSEGAARQDYGWDSSHSHYASSSNEEHRQNSNNFGGHRPNSEENISDMNGWDSYNSAGATSPSAENGWLPFSDGYWSSSAENSPDSDDSGFNEPSSDLNLGFQHPGTVLINSESSVWFDRLEFERPPLVGYYGVSYGGALRPKTLAVLTNPTIPLPDQESLVIRRTEGGPYYLCDDASNTQWSLRASPWREGQEQMQHSSSEGFRPLPAEEADQPSHLNNLHVLITDNEVPPLEMEEWLEQRSGLVLAKAVL